MNTTSEFTVEAADLRRALTTALGFASSSEYDPPVIRCVNIAPADGAVEFAATDRYVMYFEPVKATGEPFQVLIPRDIARRLLTLIPRGTRKKPTTGLVSFAKDGERVTARFVGDFDTTVTFDPEDGKFPEYHDLAEKMQTPDGEPVAPSIHFSPKLVARVCTAITNRGWASEPLHMRFISATKPLVITHGDLHAFIMPVRVKAEEAR